MASDGLWDVISSQEAVQIVATEASKGGWSADQLVNISHKLCTEAFRRGSMDNITVAVVMALPESDKQRNNDKRNTNANSAQILPNTNGALDHVQQRGKHQGQNGVHSNNMNGLNNGNTHSKDALHPPRDPNAADLWTNGAGGRKKPDGGMLAMIRPHVGGSSTKTLLQNAGRGAALGRVMGGAPDHSSSNGNNNRYMEHGSRGARANSLQHTFNTQQQQQSVNGGSGLLPPANKNSSALPAANNGYASAWGKDGGRSLRQLPVNKRAEMLSNTLRASYY
jgi:hypothetical protein